MPERVLANANPEKRLFISLLTRDIPLVAAFLDLIDNSVNAAVEPHADRLKTAQGYQAVFDDPQLRPDINICISVSSESVTIKDNAAGISLKTAEDHVFKFGRANEESHELDRLSVYGIGLKRAIFKLGRDIEITSDHANGGFNMKLNVDRWARDGSQPWTIPLTSRTPVTRADTGTTIRVTGLYDDVRRRLSDGLFPGQLREAIAKTYAFYMAKFVNIEVDNSMIEAEQILIGANHSSEIIEIDGVSCAITAGIGVPQNGAFRDRSSGWFVFCNGRTVVSADKTRLTGWGAGATALPVFQPKHRPFTGTVFFVSEDAEKLPWTTTKSGINEDSLLWQDARRHMISLARSVISYLDGRYTDEGTEITSTDLSEASQAKVSVLAASTSEKRPFSPPKAPPGPKTIRVQYDAIAGDVRKIEKYLKKPGMGGAEVGRYTFSYFLRNEVGER